MKRPVKSICVILALLLMLSNIVLFTLSQKGISVCRLSMVSVLMSAALLVILLWQLAGAIIGFKEPNAWTINKLDWSRVYILYTTLDKLLTFTSNEPYKFSAVLDKIGVKFKSQRFQVLVIDICDVVCREKYSTDDPDYSILDYVQPLGTSLSKHIGKYCGYYTLVKGDKMVCILNWPELTDSKHPFATEESENRLRTELLKTVEEMRAEHHINLRICTSGIVYGLDNLDLAYAESCKLYEQSVFYPPDICLVTEKDIEMIGISKQERIKIMNLDRQFVNLAYGHKYAEAFEKLDALIALSSQTTATLTGLKSTVVHRLQWLTDISRVCVPVDFRSSMLTLISLVQQDKSISAIRAHTKEIFDLLDEYAQAEKIVPKLNTEHVQLYIQENSRNPEMNVSTISYRWGVTVSYMSHIFKAETGVGMLDYINQCRVNDAKGLLRESSLCINEIADKAGFGSNWSLTRTFKRYEGITPTAYRALYQDALKGIE